MWIRDTFIGPGEVPPNGVRFQRGDVNADGKIDLSDAVTILNHLFAVIPAISCEKTADTDGSGRVDITDPVYLLGYLFTGGPAPSAPFPQCGNDATVDALACQSYAPCQ